MPNIVEVNGVKYSQKERKTNRVNNGTRMASIMAMASVMMITGGLGGGGYDRQRPNVDIVIEYGLIQLKKSNLTKADRDWVVFQFELNFTKV